MGKIYPAEFKKQAVELYRLDERTTYADVARDLGCSAETVRNWVAQNDIDEGRRDDGLPLTSASGCAPSSVTTAGWRRRTGS